jgi:tetratricopeptide (TPR) repeat protein
LRQFESMKVLNFYIVHRIWFIFGLIAFGIASHIWLDGVLAWICYILAAISVLLYFMVGTMRLVQQSVMEGDVDAAVRYIKMIKFPKLLFKPVRQAYFMLQSNLALAHEDLDTAEQNIRESLKTNSTLAGDVRGTNLLQLGMVQLRKGNSKEARKHLLEAVKLGIPDKDNLAAAYLQLCSIEIQRQQYRVAKEYFKRAKAAKPKNEEIVSQIQQLEKQIPRLPG